MAAAGMGRVGYARYLRAMHAVHAALEPPLQRRGFAVAKLPWLDEDLRYLGLPVPRPVDAVQPRDAAMAAGCAYVLEGAALGARVLYRQWAAPLGFANGTGARFLHGHGEETGRRWARFVATLDALVLDERELDACITAAEATFDAVAAAHAAMDPAQAVAGAAR